MNTHKRSLIIAFVLGVLLTCLAGVCGYQWLASASAASTITEQRTRLAGMTKHAEELRQAQADEQHLALNIAQHNAPWSWSEQLPVMVTQINKIVTGCGTAIETLQPSIVVEHGQLARYPLHLTLHMSVDELTQFLHRIQQARPLLAVDQLSIHAGKYAGDPLLVDVTISSYVTLSGNQPRGERS